MEVAILKLRNFLLEIIYSKNHSKFLDKLFIKLFLWIEEKE